MSTDYQEDTLSLAMKIRSLEIHLGKPDLSLWKRMLKTCSLHNRKTAHQLFECSTAIHQCH